MTQRIYKNSTEVASLGGVQLYLPDIVDASLVSRLNIFLQGDTGSGKTQLAKDAMSRFGDKSLFLLGRNDMDTRELFQRINLDKLRSSPTSADVKELTDKIGHNLTVVDELPNCVPAVRAQLFNLFDGFIELNGEAYQIGNGYSVGIATGNIGQKFTESSNDLGRALKDRMHVTVDVDHFYQKASDTLDILTGSTDPRVVFDKADSDESAAIIKAHRELRDKEIPAEKYLAALYFVHGLDHCTKGSKRDMKDRWPTSLEDREQVSIDGLVFPLSTRAAKSVLRFSQALDSVATAKGAEAIAPLDSVIQAYRLIAPYSGVLYEGQVQNNPTYDGNHYKAIDAVIAHARQEFTNNAEHIAAGLEMVEKGKTDDRVLSRFTGRWEFMKDTLESLIRRGTKESG